ncbi:hypothetical protein EDD16DRAFT_1726592, partial [Pisolithus croceorrhizus]
MVSILEAVALTLVVRYMGLLDRFRVSKRTTAVLPTDVAVPTGIVVPTDIVVFIVGPSGSGKSWFMNILLQNPNVRVQVADRQKPGATEVHAERCHFDGVGNDIVIVDTPSFCTCMDPDSEEVVRTWMLSNYTEPCQETSILYMHNLAFEPDDADLMLSNHIRAFRRTE